MKRSQVGIDFGTYNSAAAYIAPTNRVEMLRPYHGETPSGRVMPSFVKFYLNGEVEHFGEPARKDLGIAPRHVVWGIKRLLGQPFQKAKENGEFGRFKFPLQESVDGSILIPISLTKVFSPADIAALLLQWIRKDCENPELNPMVGQIERAVITHPAYFDTSQMHALKSAAADAGFADVDYIPEPEAALHATMTESDCQTEQHVIVIDLGAGTLDVFIAVVEPAPNGVHITSMFPAYGDPRFGGTDIDEALVREAIDIYNLKELDDKEENGLRSIIEEAKITLSSVPYTRCWWVYKGHSRYIKMARSKEYIPSSENQAEWIILESVVQAFCTKLKEHLDFALRDEKPVDIDRLILVGGPMHMPCIRKTIAEVFRDNKAILEQLNIVDENGFRVNPLEAVARGAALYQSSDRSPSQPFGYGYVALSNTGEITIPIGSRGPVRTENSLSCTLPPGSPIPLACVKEEVLKDGTHYYAIGDYLFHPWIDDKGKASFSTTLMMDKTGEVSLEVKDHNTGQVMSLKTRGYREIEIRKPVPPPSLPLDLNDPPPPPPIIPGQLVAHARQRATTLIATIDAGIQSGKPVSPEAIALLTELRNNLDRLPPGDLSMNQQNLYIAVCNGDTLLRNRLINDGWA